MKIDLHTHTVLSGHAYSTAKELIDCAVEKGVIAFAITDHGPQMPGVGDFYHAINACIAIPNIVNGVRIIHGFEGNIFDSYGDIDLPSGFRSKLDLIIGSIHPICILPQSKEINTRTVTNSMKNCLIDVLGHPDDPIFPLDYRKVAKVAREQRVALEVNNTSLKDTVRKNCRKNTLEMLSYAKEEGCFISLGSDAHFYLDLGELDEAEKIIEEVNYPKELIVNNSLETLDEFLEMRKMIRRDRYE